MMWLQAGICFALWIAYGWRLRNRSHQLRESMRGMPRSRRVALGSVGMLGSMMVLFGGLAAIGALGGVQNRVMTWWAWPLVAILGIGFVHMQVLGAGAMVTLVQEDQRTSSEDHSSDSREG